MPYSYWGYYPYSVHGIQLTFHKEILDGWPDVANINNGWERNEVRVLPHLHLDESSSVIELGACVGIISCLINKRLSRPRNHVAVEGNPLLINQLKSIRDQNNCSFAVENCVVGSESKRTMFWSRQPGIRGGFWGDERYRGFPNLTEHSVKQKTFSELEEAHETNFNVLWMDIEGAEYEMFNEVLFPNDYILKFNSIMCEFHHSTPQQGVPIRCSRCRAPKSLTWRYTKEELDAIKNNPKWSSLYPWRRTKITQRSCFSESGWNNTPPRITARRKCVKYMTIVDKLYKLGYRKQFDENDCELFYRAPKFR